MATPYRFSQARIELLNDTESSTSFRIFVEKKNIRFYCTKKADVLKWRMDEYPYPLATPQHRLGGLAVDIAIALVTGFIPWFIWLLIVMGQGQTPGKQLLKLRVYDSTTGFPAKWGHMFIRQMGVYISINIIQFLALFGISLLGGNYSIPTLLASGFSLLTLILWLTDALWILKDGSGRRLMDIFLKTDVLNESPQR